MDRETADLWLVVGLGNPGRAYQGNRHNVGFMVADAVCKGEESLLWQPSQRFSAELAKGTFRKRALIVAKPQTYMNLSGRSVGPLSRFYKVPLDRIMLIHDDVDLDLGRLKIKAGGGDGGHKGVRSTAEEVGSADFIRIRFGIGRPAFGDVTNYVLADFEEEETEVLEKQIHQATRAISAVITRGLREAMNRHNRAPKKDRDKESTGSETTSENKEADSKC
jgi:PTH1 family peptidyl-tRNA hydrolase